LQLCFCGMSQKMDFPFYQCVGGPERVIFCEVATTGRLQKGTTQILKGMGPSRIAIPVVLLIFWVCLYILHFFRHWMFKFKFGLRVHQINSKLFGGKYLQVSWRCGTPEIISIHLRCSPHFILSALLRVSSG
jgi:hypothetical protein